jgi:hypothetical protein
MQTTEGIVGIALRLAGLVLLLTSAFGLLLIALCALR